MIRFKEEDYVENMYSAITSVLNKKLLHKDFILDSQVIADMLIIIKEHQELVEENHKLKHEMKMENYRKTKV